MLFSLPCQTPRTAQNQLGPFFGGSPGRALWNSRGASLGQLFHKTGIAGSAPIQRALGETGVPAGARCGLIGGL